MKLLACIAAASMMAGSLSAAENTVTWTGWFAGLHCANARAATGGFTATNPDCAKACIQKGDSPAFISEQAKAVFQVKGYPVIEDLGYHVEIEATVDDASKTITIQKVTQLGYQGAACARPRQR